MYKNEMKWTLTSLHHKPNVFHCFYQPKMVKLNFMFYYYNTLEATSCTFIVLSQDKVRKQKNKNTSMKHFVQFFNGDLKISTECRNLCACIALLFLCCIVIKLYVWACEFTHACKVFNYGILCFQFILILNLFMIASVFYIYNNINIKIMPRAFENHIIWCKL